jgi:hypothetical protein
MRDVFEDKEFDSMLYGGVQDLEEGVAQTIYSLFKRHLIRTTWSCEGHVGKCVDGYSTRRPGYLIYQPGRIHFRYAANDETAVRFMSGLTSLAASRKFVSLNIRDCRDTDELEAALLLEMGDLVDQESLQMNIRDKAIQVLLEQRGSDPICYKYEVPETQAKARLEEFKQFWTELENWVKAFS